ncbi:MAG: alkyl sulfatase C-terminal domain-containing protein [Planctomycetota bacterium]|jgi:alkyl sulfatase BDS1-like metallo-beta-lactamase superfamily hydrolase
MLLAAVCVLGIMVATAYLGSLTGPRLSKGGPGRAGGSSAEAVRAMGDRLNAQAAGDVHMTAGFVFVDTGAACGLEICGGLARFRTEFPTRPDVTIQTTSEVLDGLLRRESTVEAALASGSIEIDGGAAEAERFLGYFDPPGPGAAE